MQPSELLRCELGEVIDTKENKDIKDTKDIKENKDIKYTKDSKATIKKKTATENMGGTRCPESDNSSR